ncbi:MAG: NUDIX hydrolase [Hyphomicrobiaceae bacterium]
MHDDITRGAVAPILAGGDTGAEHSSLWRQASSKPDDLMSVRLTAIVLSVHSEQPVVLTGGARGGPPEIRSVLPAVKFMPQTHPSLEVALRKAVTAATGRELGFTEQLLTDYERWPTNRRLVDDRHCLSVSYMSLMREEQSSHTTAATWLKCYDLLPWEDYRNGRPPILQDVVLPALTQWAEDGDGFTGEAASRRDRISFAFGTGTSGWDDQRVVDRFDLIEEAEIELPETVTQLANGERRLVAAALGRLRSKLRYRPVVFELLPPEFTLFELQKTVEAILGPTLHKQNFRRLVEGTRLVEATGEIRNNTGGRPAKTFRFRPEVLMEQPTPGVHVRPGRAA